ncbi:hypothetical protein LCL95_12445 [Bacillus timonensis]|nr:hypothetical protein [Bacillus timonensis]
MSHCCYPYGAYVYPGYRPYGYGAGYAFIVVLLILLLVIGGGYYYYNYFGK